MYGMETSRFGYSSVIRVALVLLCVLSVGCHQPTAVPPGKTSVCKGDQSDCGNPHHIGVKANTGVDKQDICACRGEDVQWEDPQSLGFQVEFKKGDGTPFAVDTFNNSYPKGSVKQDAGYGPYRYKVTVHGKAFDPRVVVGGGR